MLVLMTNKKSYMSFRLVPKSVTLNNLEPRNSLYFALIIEVDNTKIPLKEIRDKGAGLLCYRVLYNHIRQMAPANTNSLVAMAW